MKKNLILIKSFYKIGKIMNNKNKKKNKNKKIMKIGERLIIFRCIYIYM